MDHGVTVLAGPAHREVAEFGPVVSPWPIVWHSKHSRGRDIFSENSLIEPCGSWQFRQFSRTGACSNRNGPRFSAWHV